VDYEPYSTLARNNEINIKVNLITVENYFDRNNAIINPYGGVYPEAP
jgi:hypothetical protein